jgi:diaminopimelate epimerase
VKIFNTDGSQAEKSGNGLRIFCRFLWDIGVVGHQPFEVSTLGGVVNCQILGGGRQVSIAMGRARFLEIEKPLVDICGREFRLYPVSMGNPHCVVFVDHPEESMIKEVGPYIETHSYFPQKTNVQFVRVNDRANIEAGIWERGVGYTLSSGTSSCAAAAVAYKLGLVDNQVTVVMPGGSININLGLDFAITMRGPVCKVGDYLLSEECLACE